MGQFSENLEVRQVWKWQDPGPILSWGAGEEGQALQEEGNGAEGLGD